MASFATKMNPRPRHLRLASAYDPKVEAEVKELGVDVEEARKVAKSRRVGLLDAALLLAYALV